MIEVPESFRAMPRWWAEGTAWLDALPALVDEQCALWSLEIDGEPRHGSNALVVPVRRDGEALALRLSPPGPDVSETVDALLFWAGRGTVRLVEADAGRGALLMERLDAGRSLADLEPAEALPILGATMRRLAVSAPATVPATGELVGEEATSWRRRWSDLDEPVPSSVLELVQNDVAAVRESSTPDLAVNGDLHFEQVLAGTRESWLVVDPVLLRGDMGYDLGRVLWSRLDELGDADAVRHAADVVIGAAGLDPARARRWIRIRAVSYLLWGLERGLTEDPPRCLRLLSVFGARP